VAEYHVGVPSSGLDQRVGRAIDATHLVTGDLKVNLKSVTKGSTIRLTFRVDTAVEADDAEAGDGNGVSAAAVVYICERDDHAPRLGDIPSEGAHSPR
jgi:hypothetical protein